MTARSVLRHHAAPMLGLCVRCFNKQSATVLKSLSVGEDAYDFPLCETHADLFETQIYAWTRIGQLVTVAAPPPAWTQEAGGRPPRLDVPKVAARVVEEVEDDAVPLWEDNLPAATREMIEAHPELREWRLSRKARERASEHDIDLFAVLLAAEAPQQTTPSRDDEEVSLHTRGGITAVVNTRNRTVLTTYRRREGNSNGY